MTTPFSICIEPFKNLSTEVRNGKPTVSPCCTYPLTVVDTVDFVNDPTLNSIRQQWLNGVVPDGCSKCYKQIGGLSRKDTATTSWQIDHQTANQDLTKVELVKLDYWIGDICNLACITCGPINSSQWKQDLSFLSTERKHEILPNWQDKATINQSWKNLDFSKLELIHFWGGEPLLSKEHVEMLKAIPTPGNVKLYYSTNGTVPPTQELIDLWARFKYVDVYFSLDDIEERFEYIRYPANWQSTIDNCKWMISQCGPNVEFGIASTINVLNHPYVDSMTEWFSLNLSASKYKKIKHFKYQAISTPVTVGFPVDAAIEFLDNLDQRRNTNWRKTFPLAADQLTKLNSAK